MKEILIDKNNVTDLEQIAPRLAEIYKYDFARAPWYETSRCIAFECAVEFPRDCQPGDRCGECGNLTVEAYDAEELLAGWQRSLVEESALMEVAVDNGGLPTRATIARPTTPNELYERKYNGIENMQPWLTSKMPDEFVWIEDTFADIQRYPRGNLRTRGRTLGGIATYYGGLTLATRTRSPGIVKATVRDAGPSATVYLGSEIEACGISRVLTPAEYDTVPDERTFLEININRGES